jgi:hypothetical protein
MNQSELSKSRHFTSSAPLPEPAPKGKPIGPPHLRILEDPMFKPQSRNDGARELERAPPAGSGSSLLAGGDWE